MRSEKHQIEFRAKWLYRVAGAGVATGALVVSMVAPSATATSTPSPTTPDGTAEKLVDGALDLYASDLSRSLTNPKGVAASLRRARTVTAAGSPQRTETLTAATAQKVMGGIADPATDGFTTEKATMSIHVASMSMVDATHVSVTGTVHWEEFDRYPGASELVEGGGDDDKILTLTKVDGQFAVTDDQVIEPEETAPSDEASVPADQQPSSDVRPADWSVAEAEPRAHTSPATTAAAASASEPRVSNSRFQRYAIVWTRRSSMNPAYPSWNNNCANFASQVLANSGWTERSAFTLNNKDVTRWSHELSGPFHASWTWYNASYLNRFAYAQKRAYRHMDNIWNAHTGDLLFVDWDPHGRADGKIDHVMVVTQVVAAHSPHISQKSPSRHNIPLARLISIAHSEHRTKIAWYGLTAWGL